MMIALPEKAMAAAIAIIAPARRALLSLIVAWLRYQPDFSRIDFHSASGE